MLRPGPCSGFEYPWLSWLAARQVAEGIWYGLHPVPRSPDWYGPGPEVSVVPGPGRRTQPIGPGIPYGVGLGTTPGVPGAAISPLVGQAGPFEPRQSLRWLSTHHLPRTTRAQPLGPIFGSGIGLPGMPIGAGGVGAGRGTEPVQGR